MLTRFQLFVLLVILAKGSNAAGFFNVLFDDDDDDDGYVQKTKPPSKSISRSPSLSSGPFGIMLSSSSYGSPNYQKTQPSINDDANIVNEIPLLNMVTSQLLNVLQGLSGNSGTSTPRATKIDPVKLLVVQKPNSDKPVAGTIKPKSFKEASSPWTRIDLENMLPSQESTSSQSSVKPVAGTTKPKLSKEAYKPMTTKEYFEKMLLSRNSGSRRSPFKPVAGTTKTELGEGASNPLTTDDNAAVNMLPPRNPGSGQSSVGPVAGTTKPELSEGASNPLTTNDNAAVNMLPPQNPGSSQSLIGPVAGTKKPELSEGASNPLTTNDNPAVNMLPPQNPGSSQSLIGPVAGTKKPELEDGMQIKHKKEGPYEAVNHDEFRKDMLERHNYYRKKHEIDLLEVDDQLNNSAQAYAKELATKDPHLGMKHSYWPGLGENLTYSEARVNRLGIVSSDQWWLELQHCTTDETAKSLYDKIHQPNTIGHLTQMLWKGSTKVGFGIARSQTGAYYVVAHYTPPGNVALKNPDGTMLGMKTEYLPLPFKQEHINEAKQLSASHEKTLANGITSNRRDLNSEELALDFDTIVN